MPKKEGLGWIKLVSVYLIGMVFFTWLVFVFSLLFSFTNDPLRWGIVFGFVSFFILVVFFKHYLKLTVTPNLFWDQKGFLIFLIFAFLFSFWLMTKTFRYHQHYFRIASNIFNDFNIHLGIIRSFSWGKNFPPQLPFFAGQPLRYHFMSDFTFAILEYLGLNPGWAVNLPSIFSFTVLLVLIFFLSQKLTGGGKEVGMISILLFLFNSSLTWVKFFQKFGFSLSSFKQIWQLGSYLSAGPFDGGIISIFWNLNTFVNQRHLVFASALFLLIVYFLLTAREKKTSGLIFLSGVLTGLLPFWHSLVFLATLMIGILLVGCQGIFLFLVPVLILSFPQMIFLAGSGSPHLPFLKIGFLVADDLSLVNFTRYWFWNLGLSLLTIPVGLWLVKKKVRFYLPFFSLFALANLFQFTPNLFHNHSLLNLWIMVSNFYSALFLVWLFKKRWWQKILAGGLLSCLIFSGFLDLMVVKNDFLHQIADRPQDKLVAWITANTTTDEIFLVPPDQLYNPVNLAGRQVYLVSSHFVWGYGYQIISRQTLTKKVYQSHNKEEIKKLLNQASVDYWLTDQTVKIDLPKVYEDEKRILYRLKS